ncbi:uncharacterized protein BT62DRAFT_936819 [Guyanagaster necrorhizus]|uniref:DUF202 domain-containing protein n=1 Tax=Guyanagaster necrorhizus TaxID=856835 RepID=A0A9P7VKQ6_9AGAR|nr:uncharacterized protein BT62DRAFT_936819 [Guyanagaster necrorhizus MCA 3950]KAG7441689.1 hypothetical protein BT62DRAFT_936819 [Guyanagaster necrorhizus MCA 3950]
MRISLTLENNGSVARDHLASERTFLAYVRTSLVLASTGVALVQLFSISSSTTSNVTTFSPTSDATHRYARPLGATAVLLSLGILGVGMTRYFSIQEALTRGNYPVARSFIAIIVTSLVTLIALIFAFVLVSKK